MPRTIDIGFRDFLEKLTPSAVETEAAKTHRSSIKTRLENDFGLRRFVKIGSFGNGTSISGYSDIDYLASMSPGTLTTDSTYSLQKIRDSLDQRFPNTSVRVGCPAVVIPFGSAKWETTEVVPADFIKSENDHYVYDIPDCNGGWKRASPDAHNAYVDAANTKHSGRTKALIRFVKAWKFYRNVPISSFYLELRVAKYAAGETSIVYGVDIKNVLNQLRNASLAAMQDPMGISGYIAACKTKVQHDDAISRLDTAATRAENACAASANGDVSGAFDWWRLLYNDAFPSYYY